MAIFSLGHSKKGKFMLKKYTVILLFMLFVSFSSNVFGQGDPFPPPPPNNPIDGGIGILLALGIGYAVKKLAVNRK